MIRVPGPTARLRALVLLLAFLATGTSLPGLDALLYHWQSAEAPTGLPHLEEAGNCHGHDGHCALGGSLPTARGAEPAAGIARSGAAAFAPPPRPAHEAPRALRPATTAHPRAPPSRV
ncbi:MAG TPA: hypothetical protein VNK43_06155 [Gemmatimonadales bacterium]|nr:hypothetical protein [Gemmatimonadales bacterium]